MPTYLSPGVYIEEKEAGSRPIEGVGTAVAAFVGATQLGPIDQPTLITNWAQFVNTFGEISGGSYTPLSVYNYFNNGGGSCYVVRIGGGDPTGEAVEPPLASAELTSGAKAGLGAYDVKAVEPGQGATLSVEAKLEPPAEGEETSELFTLIVKKNGRPAETHEHLSPRKGKHHAPTVIAEASQLIRLEEIGNATISERVPTAGEVELASPAPVLASVTLESDAIIGDTATRSGINGLEAIDDVTMIAIPDLMAAYQAGDIDLQGVQVVQQALIDHCENMGNRMAILDPPPDLSVQQVKEWRVEATGYDSMFATLYWPWIEVYNPAAGIPELMPPSSAMAGVWGRTDDTRGVHKAPGNEIVRGAIGLAANTTRPERDQLNPVGINVILAQPGMGIRVWGARTLSSDTSWRYINVRRLFNYIETSILQGTQWVVFEPNDLELWQRIKRTINGFLANLWRQGALFGATPADAFYVKCDAETNPPSVIDAGQVIIEIGICPVKPAEFVVFQISQLASGGTADAA